MFRPTVTQLRVAIVVTNLGVTALVAALPAYRMFNPHEGIGKDEVTKMTQLDPRELAAASRGAGPLRNYVTEVTGVGDAFKLDPPPPPPKLPSDNGGTQPPQGPDDPDIVDPGPLDENWEYIGGIYVGYNDKGNYAFLRKKEAEGAATPTRPSTVRVSSSRARTTSSASRLTSRARTLARARAQQADTQKSLRVFERWEVDENEGPAIYVVRINPDQFVYQVQGDYTKEYALARQRDTIYVYDKDRAAYDVSAPEDDTPAEDAGGDASASEEKKNLFFIDHNPPTLEEQFLERQQKNPGRFTGGGSAGGGSTKVISSSSAPSTASTSSSGARRVSSSTSSTVSRSRLSSRSRTPPTAEEKKAAVEDLKEAAQNASAEEKKVIEGMQRIIEEN